jgi:fatty-acyl-CoA synthase
VIGVPDENWGEAVKAVIVLKPDTEAGANLVEELKTLVKDMKGSVQSPKSIDFVDAIPLTPVGKPDKKTLKAQYWEGTDRGVG